GGSAAGKSRRAARRNRAVRRAGWARRGLPASSPPKEFGCHQQHRQRLRLTLSALDGVASLSRGKRADNRFRNSLRVKLIGNPLSQCVGDIEALTQAVEPGGAVVGETFRRWRSPQRFA